MDSYKRETSCKTDRKQGDNNKMNLKEMRLENTGWIHLAQDCAQCKVPVTVMNLLLSQKTGIS